MKHKICNHCGTVCTEVENPVEAPYFCPECKVGFFDFEVTEIDDTEHLPGKRYHTTRHMCVDIQGLLNMYKRRKMVDVMTTDEGRKMSDAECREYLAKCQSNGWTVLPLVTGAECPDFDYFRHGCPGHLKRVETIKEGEE
jgi:hypothetical protein